MSTERTIEEIKDPSKSPAEERGWKIQEAMESATNEILNGELQEAAEHAHEAKKQAELMQSETEADLKATQDKLWEHIQEENRPEALLQKAALHFAKAQLHTALIDSYKGEWQSQIDMAKEASAEMAETLKALR